MAGNYNPSTKNPKKGFAGISSMVSDVDTETADASGKSSSTPASTSQPSLQREAKNTQSSSHSSVSRGPLTSAGSFPKILLLVLVLIIGAVVFVSSHNNQQNAPTSSTGASALVSVPDISTGLSASSSTSSFSLVAESTVPSTERGPNTNFTSITTETGETYSIPSIYAAEIDVAANAAREAKQDAAVIQRRLHADNQAIETAQAQYESLAARRDQLGESLEAQRRDIDQSDENAISTFNSRVNQYNSMGDRLKQMGQKLDADIYTYNQNVSAAQQKIDRANQLVEIYNSKLKSYGTRRN